MSKVYDIVTNKIIEYLEQGVIPWRMPWLKTAPQNLDSKRFYNGFNIIMLQAEATLKGYKTNLWVTFRQCKKLGGSIKAGEHPTMVIFWKRTQFENTKETGELDDDGKPITEKTYKTVPLLRYYNVWNIDQTTIPADKIPQIKKSRFKPITRAERIIKGCQGDPEIKHGGDRAYYSPMGDYIQLPTKNKFSEATGYYSTAFHEIAHWTGAKPRLGRFNGVDSAVFGSESYSQEELIAELTSAFLCGVCDIEKDTIENQAAYIKGWLKRLKNDKKLIVVAAAQAQKAADYIQGNNN